MKIVVANFVADPHLGGGTAAKSVALARALASAGVQTRLITTDLGLGHGGAPDVGTAEVIVIPAVFRRFPVPRAAGRRIANAIERSDAVILLNHWNVFNARMFLAARRARVPVLFCPAGALRIQGRSRLLKRAYHQVIGRRMIDEAAALIATTRVEEAEFRAAGIPAGRIQVIPNGINTEPHGITADQFRDRHRLGSAPFILFMGRLNAIKGPDLLLDAFAALDRRFPEWHLVIAGRDEGLAASLRQRAERTGITSRVHLVGHLDAASSTGAYRAASLLVVPSRHEAMSLVALEAAVNGTAVLLTDVCGFNEVEQSGGGRVVAATAPAIAEGLERLLAVPAALPAMGDRLRAHVVASFGWPTIVQHYIALVTRARDSHTT